MDRGFLDCARLYRFHQAGSFFVTRAKSNIKARRRYSHRIDRSTGLICDQTIFLTGVYSPQDYQAPLRRIRFKDPETATTLIFLTNNFTLPAFTITELSRCRWQVELFFILSLTMFERMPLDQLLAQTVTDDIDADSGRQLILFE